MSSTVPHTRSAVVIGGSLAGLCAARALVDHYEQVTVVERDRFPDAPRVRAGVPQAHHLHVLVTAGQRALDQLFPGLIAELHGHGAVRASTPTDVLYLSTTGWRDRFPATHELVGASRELIDWVVRGRLLTDPRVRFLPGHEAVGLLPDEHRTAIAGVTLRPRGNVDGVERLDADLVVDASGRGSHTPDWLAALGYGRPDEIQVDSKLGYASRRYTLPSEVTDGWKNILIMPKPPENPRGAVLYPIENDRWMLTLGGMGDDVPPTDENGFLEFVRGLRSPLLYEVIREAKPDGPVHGFRRTANHRRRYEQMARWPDGFLVVGDAACAFNPVYGHGMSVAAQTGVVLDEHLRTHPGVPGRSAQAAIARCSTTAWDIATGADRRYPTTVGNLEPSRSSRLSRWYLDRTSRVADRDPYVARAFTDVLHLVAPPTALFRPGVAARVLRGPTRPPLSTPPMSTSSGAQRS
ncbi:FAD-dependent oxidoreductase [Plantactinospora sonchi]|uniref:FAD-dependent monooxygenase n=1 Tax=Plantactinospora sonchi TaxID=1544735 RepID=A0ABU7S0Z7_9ACTN